MSRYVRKYLGGLKQPEAEEVKKKRKQVVQTKDPRTVIRRLKRLEADEAKHHWGIGSWLATTWKNLDRLLPALSGNKYATTTNKIGRFFRTFKRFYKTRGGFHSVLSDKRKLILFLVVYLLTQSQSFQAANMNAHFEPARIVHFFS